MISNEHGFNFIEIPFSGGDLFVEIFKETNRDLKIDGVLIDKSIQYYNCAIVKNPYQRACRFTKMVCNLEKKMI